MSNNTTRTSGQKVVAILSDADGTEQNQTLANYLPGSLEISDELGWEPEHVSQILADLKIDAIRNHVAIVRVLDSIECDGAATFADITAIGVEKVRAEIEAEIEASKLTRKEKAALAKYEELVVGGLRQSAEALRSIRDGRLYRETFSSWDGYCTARWHFSGTSGDNKITWLNITESLEKKCGHDVALGVNQAKDLLKLNAHPRLLVDALVAADGRAKDDARKRKDDDVRSEVKRRLAYVQNEVAPEVMSLEEFEAMSDAGIPTSEVCSVLEKVRIKEADGLSFSDALDATDDVVSARRQKPKAPRQTTKSRTTGRRHKLRKTPRRMPQNSTDPTSRVRQLLDDVLASMMDALATDWPHQDQSELTQIYVVAESCEEKLAEISTRVNEALNDADEQVAASTKEA